MRLILTGGHLTPAYSFAEYAKNNSDQIILVGSAGVDSVEANQFKTLGYEYVEIYPVKFNRYQKLKSIIKLPEIIIPSFQSLKIVKKFKPDCVVSFGSFNAIPVCFIAYIMGIPVVIHEQTRVVGLANRILAKIASVLAVSYPESERYFLPNKTVLTGNLLRQAIWQPPDKITSLELISKPILYITGGNQGSQTIVSSFLPILKTLSESFQIIIQSGKQILNYDQENIPNLIIRRWFEPEEMSWILHHSRIVVSRGGANTVSELMAVGVPSIIIPLPSSSSNEQQKNAEFIVTRQAGILINQEDLSGQTLLSAINKISENYRNYKENALKLKTTQNPSAVKELYKLTLSLVKNHEKRH